MSKKSDAVYTRLVAFFEACGLTDADWYLPPGTFEPESNGEGGHWVPIMFCIPKKIPKKLRSKSKDEV